MSASQHTHRQGRAGQGRDTKGREKKSGLAKPARSTHMHRGAVPKHVSCSPPAWEKYGQKIPSHSPISHTDPQTRPKEKFPPHIKPTCAATDFAPFLAWGPLPGFDICTLEDGVWRLPGPSPLAVGTGEA